MTMVHIFGSGNKLYWILGNGRMLVKLLQFSLATPFVHSREYTPGPSLLHKPTGVPG